MKKTLLLLSLSLLMLFAWSQDKGEAGTSEKPTLQEIQRNTVSVDYRFVFLSALYERIFPLGKKTGLIAGAGIAQGIAGTGATNPIVKASFLFGRYRHFLDAGIIVAPLGNDLSVLNPMVGYRFQSPKGLYLGVSVVIASDKDDEGDGEESTDISPVPGISIGFSF